MFLNYFPIESASDVERNIFPDNSERELLTEASEKGGEGYDEHEQAPLVRLGPHLVELLHIHEHEEHLRHHSADHGHQGALYQRYDKSDSYVNARSVVIEELHEV